MNPAFSVIFFTTASGAGYGLWFLLGLSVFWAPDKINHAESLVMLGVGFIFVSVGLLSALLHLGHPERSWRALSQWRSSWLSREGWASLVTYLPSLGLGVYLWNGNRGTAIQLLGGLLACGAAATVFCTVRIYTSLKTIHAWHNAYVMPVYLLLGLLTGALWSWVIASSFGQSITQNNAGLLIALVALSVCSKLAYWRYIDTTQSIASPESATGLGYLGKVRSFEQPHTEENYLLKEMGFALGRKHAKALRQWSMALIFFVPTVLILLALGLPHWNLLWSLLAALCASVGVIAQRWLFFAEAKHVITLYYGAKRA